MMDKTQELACPECGEVLGAPNQFHVLDRRFDLCECPRSGAIQCRNCCWEIHDMLGHGCRRHCKRKYIHTQGPTPTTLLVSLWPTANISRVVIMSVWNMSRTGRWKNCGWTSLGLKICPSHKSQSQKSLLFATGTPAVLTIRLHEANHQAHQSQRDSGDTAMNDLDRQADLTNPDVLAALEIAEVRWDRCRLVVRDGRAAIEEQIESAIICGEFNWLHCRLATPADLDHALKEWLFTWLLEKLGDMEWAILMVTLIPAIADGESPLLVAAAAVVKVGEPSEESDDVCSTR